jgi:hypothetical protein
MEHGAMGESRARAFLLNRFWVLERSVDIHGADYLIQRRLSETNFLDRDPPRLGIVQVKFIQDASTNISVQKHYVLDRSGIPHEEFFLLVFSGHEDEERMFLLSGKEIVESCPLRVEEKKEAYLLTGKRLLSDSEFEIASTKRALDRIEHALKNADFVTNRRFIASSQYVELSPDQIEHEFLLPIENDYADIPAAFYQQKEKLQRTLFELEDLTKAIGTILRSTDPETAYQLFESGLEPYLQRGGLGGQLAVSCDAFDDEDLLAVVKNHKRRLAKLKEMGIAEAYFDLHAAIEKAVIAEVSAMEAIAESDVVKVTVEYAPKNLKNPSIRLKRSSRESEKFPSVKESELGRHVIYFKPREWLSWEVRAGKESAPRGKEKIQEMISKGSRSFKLAFQKEIDLHVLGKELVSPWG